MIPRASGCGREAVAFTAACAVLGALPKLPRRSKSSGWSPQAASARTAVPARNGAERRDLVISIRSSICAPVVRGCVMKLVSSLIVAPQPFDQRHEPHRAQFVIVEAVLVPGDTDQALHRVRLTNRQHHDTADFHLRQERAGRVFGG